MEKLESMYPPVVNAKIQEIIRWINAQETTQKKKRTKPEQKLAKWLAERLGQFEPGMVLVDTQYPLYWGDMSRPHKYVLDILAKDQNGLPVIIEVKLRATRFTIPQQLEPYMKCYHPDCRGIVAALSFPKSVNWENRPDSIDLWNLKESYNAKNSPCKKS